MATAADVAARETQSRVEATIANERAAAIAAIEEAKAAFSGDVGAALARNDREWDAKVSLHKCVCSFNVLSAVA